MSLCQSRRSSTAEHPRDMRRVRRSSRLARTRSRCGGTADAPASDVGGPKGSCRCKSCQRDQRAVVVKLANTPGREPGEPQGYCAFESRQPYQFDFGLPILDFGLLKLNPKSKIQNLKSERSRSPIGRGRRLKPGPVLVRIQPGAPRSYEL